MANHESSSPRMDPAQWRQFCFDTSNSGESKEAAARVASMVKKYDYERTPTPEDGERWLKHLTLVEASKLGDSIENNLKGREPESVNGKQSYTFGISPEYTKHWLMVNEVNLHPLPLSLIGENTPCELQATHIPPHRDVLTNKPMGKERELQLRIGSGDNQWTQILSMAHTNTSHFLTTNNKFISKKADVNVILAYQQLFSDAKRFIA